MSINRERILLVLETVSEACGSPIGFSLDSLQTKLELALERAVDRKALYADLQAIADQTDFEIVYDPSARAYRVSRVDALAPGDMEAMDRAVLAARFLSHETKERMLQWLQTVTGSRRPKGLADVTMLGQPRREEGFLASVSQNAETLRAAMAANCRVCFDYGKRTASGFEIVHKNCLVSPYVDVWYQDYLYLLGSFDAEQISHYRIDRITNLEMRDEPRIPISQILGHHRGFDVKEHLRKRVAPSSGAEELVAIRFDRTAMADVIDQLGEKTVIVVHADESFTVRTRLVVNKTLVRWVLGFGSAAVVVRPDWLQQEIRTMLEQACTGYHQDVSEPPLNCR